MTHSFPTRRSSDLVVVVQYRTYHTIFVHALFLKTGVTSGNVVPSRNGTNTITKGIVRSLSRKADDVGINVRRKTKSSGLQGFRSEEHTSELQSLMRISYAVFCLKKKKNIK